jgi:hypothetical protein
MTSVNMIFFMGGPQLGEFESGIAAQFLGAPLAVILGGIGCLLTVVIVAIKAPILPNYVLNFDPPKETTEDVPTASPPVEG